eukprot:scaffold393_cov104-Isochrysis_galbana.AAC.3
MGRWGGAGGRVVRGRGWVGGGAERGWDTHNVLAIRFRLKGDAEIDCGTAPAQVGRHDVGDRLLLPALEQVLQQQVAPSGIAKRGAWLLLHLERHVAVWSRLGCTARDEVEHGREGIVQRDAVDVVHAQPRVVHQLAQGELVGPLCWLPFGGRQLVRRFGGLEERGDGSIERDAGARKVVDGERRRDRLGKRSDLEEGGVGQRGIRLDVSEAGGLHPHSRVASGAGGRKDSDRDALHAMCMQHCLQLRLRDERELHRTTTAGSVGRGRAWSWSAYPIQ